MEKILRKDVIGRPVTEVFPGVIDFGLLDVFRRVWQTGESEHCPVSAYKDERIESWRENYVYRLPTGEVVAIYDDVTAEKRIEEELRKSEEKYRRLVDNTKTGFVAVDEKGVVLEANEPYVRLTGQETISQVLGHNVFEWTAPESIDNNVAAVKQCAAEGFIENFETTYLGKTGKRVEISVSATVRTTMNGIAIDSMCRDITERKRAEKQIAASLNEKEVLLREIHHRVKNNMQVIVSLLRMHSRRTDDEQLGQVFDDCRDRINAMSLIHEALYLSDNIARIDFESYLKKLCRNLSHAHGASGKGVAVMVERCNVSLDMDQGIAVGMVICELVSNAFKHAFPPDKGGNVSLSLFGLKGTEVELIVQDNGKGLPAEFDIFNSPSLGLRLVVATVTRELGGSIEVDYDGGTRFIIRFECDKD